MFLGALAQLWTFEWVVEGLGVPGHMGVGGGRLERDWNTYGE